MRPGERHRADVVVSTFTRPRRRFRVDFAEHQDETLHGLVVVFTSMSMGKLLELMRLVGDGARTAELLEQLIERIADGIVEWNYCEEGSDQVAPISVETLKAMDPDLVFILAEEWQDAIAGVPTPLAQTSNGGPQSLAALPTTAL